VAERLETLRAHQQASGMKVSRIKLEPEIKVVMLEMLVNNFFGGQVSEKELRNRFVPALEMLIDYMISDTVAPITLVLCRMVTGRNAILKQKKADFDELTDIALSGRAEGLGLWKQFKSDATDEELRSKHPRISGRGHGGHDLVRELGDIASGARTRCPGANP